MNRENFRINNAFSMIIECAELSLLFVLCSLPVITIGAATSALYTETLAIINKKEGYIGRDFFHAIKSNFRQATLTWLLLLATGVVLYLDIRISNYVSGMAGTVLRSIFWVLAFIWCSTSSYIFPLIANFNNSIRNTIKNAFWLSIGNLPYTISLLVIEALPWFICYLIPDLEIRLIIPVMIIIGFGLQAWICSWIFRRIFCNFSSEYKKQN